MTEQKSEALHEALVAAKQDPASAEKDCDKTEADFRKKIRKLEKLAAVEKRSPQGASRQRAIPISGHWLRNVAACHPAFGSEIVTVFCLSLAVGVAVLSPATKGRRVTKREHPALRLRGSRRAFLFPGASEEVDTSLEKIFRKGDRLKRGQFSASRPLRRLKGSRDWQPLETEEKPFVAIHVTKRTAPDVTPGINSKPKL